MAPVNLFVRKPHGLFIDVVGLRHSSPQPAKIRRNQGAVDIPNHHIRIPFVHQVMLSRQTSERCCTCSMMWTEAAHTVIACCSDHKISVNAVI